MKLSIIIPSLGRSSLNEVMNGIKACQDFKTIRPEIIVVFDGVEPTPLSQHPEVTVLRTEKSVGAGPARNLAMDKARGDVLVFISDDTIPEKMWLKKIQDFHIECPEKEVALLGKVSWTEELAKDKFHQWLENHAQFQYGKLRPGHIKKNAWQYFYTSNISVKASFCEHFSDQFDGWGFEDIELGYRLAEKNLTLWYDDTAEVFHDHPQTPESMVEMTQSARANAEDIERLHPEIEVLPDTWRLSLLTYALTLGKLLVPFSQTFRWWWMWKKAWIGEE